MVESQQFRAVYESAGVYDERLLPHYYGGVEDVDIVARHLLGKFGRPTSSLDVVEFGCGTGRISQVLVPYAEKLTACDYSQVMISAIQDRFPCVETMVGDTRDLVAKLHEDGRGGAFDVVAAFWSLSYPIGEFFETMSADGIIPVTDFAAASRAAEDFVSSMVSLLAPGGRLIALYFDSDTPEQKLVTRMWERIASFPDGGRGYTRKVLLRALRSAEDTGVGTLSVARYGGCALAADASTAREWFNVVHFKGLPALVGDSAVARELDDFIGARTTPTGEVLLPSGVHLVDFQRVNHPLSHVPPRY
ncbi:MULTISPECIES: class I SAM-dependent methyltransferase [unclassified Pseudonocardia]|uniref:class I SAM-dependent DNA methyltransferase n=1 Tax=unclassified Pseudonocardia TaxID=2619320 RepID=UPI0001FFDA46|nr:class I SAM-dependent methyltransferase [Pseudonocardia sp. Ae707_Ps1]OLM20443.1 hypothetical protein Ae707Ps1_4702c [Pseudonocardia sp. Ae707_Ps1]